MSRAWATRWSPAGVAVAVAAVYAWRPPLAPDLAAQTAWGELFDRAGFVPWFGGWYGGTPIAGYSVVSPAVLGVLGPGGTGAIALVLTAAVGTFLLRGTARPVLGAAALVFAAWLNLLSGRVTFALGAALAIGALLAVRHRRWPVAALIALLAVATSPVAGVLLLVPLAAVAVVDRDRRVVVAATAGAVVVGLVALRLMAATTVGAEPYPFLTLAWSAGLAGLVAVATAQRVVRIGALMTIAVELLAFVVPNPVGSTVDRLVLIGAIPAIVATCQLRRRDLALAVAAAVAAPIAVAAVDVVAAGSVSAQPTYTAGLAARLTAEPLLRTHRLELVDTSTHWAATRLLPSVTLARGWERQLDEARNPLFYAAGSLTPASYRQWLDQHAVAFVAVPRGAEIDYGSAAEARLVRHGLPYLHEVWSDDSWRLYDVSDPAAAVVGPARAVRWLDTGIAFDAQRAGRLTVRVAYSPYLDLRGGTVLGGNDTITRVRVDGPGRHVLRADW